MKTIHFKQTFYRPLLAALLCLRAASLYVDVSMRPHLNPNDAALFSYQALATRPLSIHVFRFHNFGLFLRMFRPGLTAFSTASLRLERAPLSRKGHGLHVEDKEVPSGSILFIPDADGRLDRVRAILHHANYLTAGGSWSGGSAALVQMGDMAARSPNSLIAWEAMGQLQTDARQSGGRVVRLIGNHEWKFMTDDSEQMDIHALGKKRVKWLGALIRTDLAKGHAQIAFAVGEFLVTHAGFTPAQWPEFRRAVIDETGHKNPSAADMADYLNAAGVQLARGENSKDESFVKTVVGIHQYAKPGTPFAKTPQIIAHNVLSDIMTIDPEGLVIGIDVGNGEEKGHLGYLTMDSSGEEVHSILLHKDSLRPVVKKLHREHTDFSLPYFSFRPFPEQETLFTRTGSTRILATGA